MINGVIIFWLIVLTNILYHSAEICDAKWKTTFIRNRVNNLIVGAMEHCHSVLVCSFLCRKSTQYESFYYSSAQQECYCNTQLDEKANTTTVDTGLIYGIRETQEDCLDLYQQGFSTDGVYVIYPVCGVPMEVWCDMTGGGWTVIQRRKDGTENFNRTWNDYVKGFGNRTGEYWLGLETMHELTKGISVLRIELESNTTSGFQEYSSFAVGASITKYKLSASGFTGNCGYSLSTCCNGMMFSTLDFDNDNAAANCASVAGAGWWYNYCYHSNPNMLYAGGTGWFFIDSTCMTSANKSVMKIKRSI